MPRRLGLSWKSPSPFRTVFSPIDHHLPTNGPHVTSTAPVAVGVTHGLVGSNENQTTLGVPVAMILHYILLVNISSCRGYMVD